MRSLSVSRRQILATLAISTTAGCVDRFTTGDDSGIQLGSLHVSNTTDKEQAIEMLIERDDTIVYDQSLTVEGNDGIWVDPTWSSEPAVYDFYYVIHGRDEILLATLDESQVVEPEGEDFEGECAFAYLRILESDAFTDSILSAVEMEEEEAICNF